MGEGNAFSVSRARSNTIVSDCTGRGDENRYADESTSKAVRFLQK